MLTRFPSESRNDTPVAVTGGRSFSQVTAGHFYTCAVTPGDRAYCWGRNAEGQLGDGTTISRSSPSE
jgi:alpha-tubulin suppressor-like RCC1 family protein